MKLSTETPGNAKKAVLNTEQRAKFHDFAIGAGGGRRFVFRFCLNMA